MSGAHHIDDLSTWLKGEPMDPVAVRLEPLQAVPGVPFAYPGASAVIVGETGGGRSALLEACLYDASKAGQRCAYLGGEITQEEFNARAAVIAHRRSDRIEAELRAQLASVRYLDLFSTIALAWRDPQAWVSGVVGAYDIAVIDPLSAVASALDLDFDKSNADYVRAFDRLFQPLTKLGVTVLIVENVGHAEDAKRRAKGASAKGDRADLTFACSAVTNPPGLAIKAQKVRSVRAPFQRGDEWLFERDTQRIQRRAGNTIEPDHAFRPTTIMQRVSELLERDEGLSANAVRTAIGGRSEYVTLALQLLVSEGYIVAEKDGQAHRHRSLKPYREPTESTESPPCPNRVPDPVPGTESTESPLRSRGRGDGPGENGHGNGLTIADAEAIAAEYEGAPA
jgi:KaiC/GvpD/RAD55 family RecA-like ATPase